MKDVVVLIPGIGGSSLSVRGKPIWDFSAGAFLRGVLSLGSSIDRLKLVDDSPDADDLGDGVVATRLLPDLHIVPGLEWRIDGYGKIAERLIRDFGCVPGENYFELPYDWRRDNRVAARKLARAAHDWLHRWRDKSGNSDAKLILIAHSMGGIIARLYLETLDGWQQTRSLITFGTPYSGSVNALGFLANGFRKALGPFTVDISQTLRSFTSVYQLLPSYRCLSAPDGRWLPLDQIDWTGTKVDGARVSAALKLQRDLRAQVDSRRASGQPGYEIRPVVGDYQRTLWSASLVGGAVTTSPLRDLDEEGGDGTVPKVSAVPHEFLADLTNVAYFSQSHASLQNDRAVLDHLGGFLRRLPTNPDELFPAKDNSVAVEVDDVISPEPLVVRAQCSSYPDQLTATLHGLANGSTTAADLQVEASGWATASFEGLSPQDYRVTVAGPTEVHPVTVIASVVDLAEVAVANPGAF